MDIEFRVRRTGGIAGLTTPPVGRSPWIVRRTGDSERLSSFDRAARAFASVAAIHESVRGPSRDGFVYEIALVGGELATVAIDEDALPPELQWVVDSATQIEDV